MALSEIVARLPLPAEGLERSQVERGRGRSLEEKEELVESALGDLPGVKGAAVQTTLMVRNIPLQYTQEMLALEWANNGVYDFLYVPLSSDGQQNMTYCFINFTSEEQARQFAAYWHKRRLAHFHSRKPLTVGFATVQGFSQNLLHFKRKSLRRQKRPGFDVLPLLFAAGVQVPSEHVIDAIRQEERITSERAVEQRAWQAQSSHSGVAMASVQEEACTAVVDQDLEGVLLYL